MSSDLQILVLFDVFFFAPSHLKMLGGEFLEAALLTVPFPLAVCVMLRDVGARA